MQLPNDALLDILRHAYSCRYLDRCREAEISPSKGLIPRGFVGATGRLEDVEAVFVMAEPGHPLEGEHYTEGASPDDLMRESIAHTYRCFRSSKEAIHRNVRWIMDQIWPGDFDEQMKKVWITEGRLCSIHHEIKWFTERTCAPAYLKQQIRLLPQATIVLFGGKAADRASRIPIQNPERIVKAVHVANPGANQPKARPSWEHAINMIKARRAQPAA